MNRFLLVLACLFAATAIADDAVPQSVCINCEPGGTVIVSAQSHADYLARRNAFGHCSRRGGGYEGIGFSTVSPDAACQNACYWGRRRVREIGTAWCPARRGWIAVVRYE